MVAPFFRPNTSGPNTSRGQLVTPIEIEVLKVRAKFDESQRNMDHLVSEARQRISQVDDEIRRGPSYQS